MKKKNLVSIILSVIVLVGAFAIPTTSNAATNTVNTFKQGQLVRCNNYLYSSALQTSGTAYTLYKTKLNGTSKVVLSTNLNSGKVYTYKNTVFYQTANGIYNYSSLTNKTKLFYNNSYTVQGICSKGLICKKKSNDYVYLITFKKAVKKLAGNKNSYYTNFLGASSKYVYTTEVSYTYTPIYIKIKAYNVSTGKTKVASKVSMTASANYIEAFDFHTFKNCVVFNLGQRLGSSKIFKGNIYRMNIDGTKAKKLCTTKDVGTEFTPGKNCVYFERKASVSDTKNVLYKINENGKLAKVKTTKAYLETTANGKMLYTATNKLVCANINGTSKITLYNGNKLILSTYPTDTKVNCNVIGQHSYMALVNCRVYTNTNSTSINGKTLKRLALLVNTKTNTVIGLG